MGKAKKTQDEKNEEIALRREILRTSKPLQKADFHFVDTKKGVTDADGRLTLTSLNPMTAYVAFEIVDFKDIVELVKAGKVGLTQLGFS